jgi:glycosyltransferase involved in cell wall biosynthesis
MFKPRPKRILVLAPQPFYEDRGTPIALRHVLEAISQLGYQADVLTFPVGADVDLPGIRLIRVKNRFSIRHVPIGFSLRKLFLDVEMAIALRRLLKQSASDYVGIHAVEEAAFLAVLLGRRYRLPVVYDMQSSLPEQLRQRWQFRSRPVQSVLRFCERWLLNQAKLVVCSAGLAHHVQRARPQETVREWWFPVGFGSDGEEVAALRRELHIAPGTPVVVYSGTFETYQGLSTLLQAIPSVRAEVPGVAFVLVGRDGSAGDTLVREAHERGLLGNGVHLLPRQPRAQMGAFLALADVLVSPRCKGGNLPLKIYDYLAAGRPIVATDLPVHKPALSAERALLVGATPAQIAQGIVAVLRDPARAASLGSTAQAYARQNLGQEMFVRWIDGLYHELGTYARAGARG